MNPGKQAIMDWFRHYLAMPGDADIEVSGGHMIEAPKGREAAGRAEIQPAERVLLLSVSSPGHDTSTLGMPADDARAFADIVEQTMHRFPGTDGLSNLILALRGGADLLDRGAKGARSGPTCRDGQ